MTRVARVQAGWAAELRHLQFSLPVLRPDPAFVDAARRRAEVAAVYGEQCLRIARALAPSAEALHSNGEAALLHAEDQRIADLVLRLGFVPHGELWHDFAEIDETGMDAREFALRTAEQIWPGLRSRLALTRQDCLNDDRLFAEFGEMLRGHDNGLFGLARNSLPAVIGRAIRCVRRPNEPSRECEWLRREVGKLPIAVVGGFRSFRVWKILFDKTFDSCWADVDANAIGFPNRHALAHGYGSLVATAIDSLNAILLAHFVIDLTKAARDRREEETPNL